MEDQVHRKCGELNDRLPEEYNEDDYKAKIQKLGGLAIPLNIFLYQEIERLKGVIDKVRFQLGQLQLAIKGEVVMTDELQEALGSLGSAKVPRLWIWTVANDEFSWNLTQLGAWFTSLIARDDQNRTWMNTGRPTCFWFTGWFNPAGFLTAMKQEVTRKHKQEKWALDDVIYRTETTSFERVDQVRSPPPEGVYSHGLFMDGAAWGKSEGTIVESEPKKLFASCPVLFLSANQRGLQAKLLKEQFGAVGPYDCPVYKYPHRYEAPNPGLIFMVTLKCDAVKNPYHWTLRGLALLCNSES